MQELDVAVDGAPEGVPAISYPDLVGPRAVGDRVCLNTTALDLGLGTGGHALVIAPLDDVPAPPAIQGHVVKARYTPLQVTVPAVDAQDSPHHALLRDADDLGDLPVVVADLHSAVPAVLAGIRDAAPAARVGYVMTDWAALPMALSRTVAGLRSAGWLAVTVTAGQAYGGDLETVSVHTGLLAARLVGEVDIVVLAQGPGNAGSGTRWGFGGVACGDAVNAAGILGGRPVAALRVSAVDPRPRHRGVSHHSLTAYGRVALHRADVAVPVLPGTFGAEIHAAVQPLAARHRLVEIDVGGLAEVLQRCPVPLVSMGRTYDADPACFLASAAAGRHAAHLLS